MATPDPFADVRRKAARASEGPLLRQLAIVQAVEETIAEQRDPEESAAAPTPNEYFVALVTAMGAVSEEETLGDLLFLADRASGGVKPQLLRTHFEVVAGALQGALEALQAVAEVRPSTAALCRCLSLVGTLLVAQDASASRWQQPRLLQLVHLLFTYFDDSRPKVRKAAQLAVTRLLQHHHALAAKAGEGATTALARHLGDFAAAACHSASEAVSHGAGALGKRETQPVLHLCGFLQTAVAYLPASSLSKLVEELFAVATAGGQQSSRKGAALVETVCYQTLAVAVAHPLCRIDAKLLRQMLQRLMEAQPRRRDSDASGAHGRLLAAVLLQYGDMDAAAAAQLAPRVLQLLVAVFELGEPKAFKAVAGAIANLVQRMLPRLLGGPEGAAAIEALSVMLQLRFQAAWGAALPLLGAVFAAAREASAGADLAPVRAFLETIGGLYDALLGLPEAAPPEARQALRDAVGDAVEHLGAGFVLEALPLSEDPHARSSTGLREGHTWLLPILRSRIGGSPDGGLQFFRSTLLPLASQCDARARVGEGHSSKKKKASAATARLRCIAVWGLLPPIARGASDIAVSLAPLAPTLAGVLADERYPELLAVACASLRALVFRSRERSGAPTLQDLLGPGDPQEAADAPMMDADDDLDAESQRHRALRAAYLGGDEAWRSHADVQALSAMASRFLPILFGLLDSKDGKSTTEEAGPPVTASDLLSSPRVANLSKAIAAYASVAPAALLQRLLKQLVQRLLAAAAEVAGSEGKPDPRVVARGAMLCELASALAPFVSPEGAELLLRVVRPLVRADGAPALQKRSYKLLATWLTHFGGQVTSEDERLPQLLALMTESILSISPSARAQRLKCLSMLVTHLEPRTNADHAAVLPQLLSETVVCTKDANGKARAAAYDFLGALARCSGDVPLFLSQAVGGLAARTPQMKAASALCLARLIFDFGRAPGAPGPATLSKSAEEARAVCSIVPDLLATTLELLKEGSREVAKATLALVRVCIGACPAPEMERLLSRTVTALMTWTAERDRRSHLRTIIKRILGKLCRRYGFPRIAAMVPEGDQPLMAYMEKMARKEQAKKQQRRERQAARFRDDGGDEDDADDVHWYFSEDEDEEDGREGDEMELAAGVGDLMSNEMGDFRSKRGQAAAARDDGEELGVVEFDADGRILVRAEDEDEMCVEGDENAPEAHSQAGSGKARKRRRNADEEDVHERSAKAGRRKPARGETGRHTGERYKSKKAGGDVLKKGTKLEPYAYIPLDPRSLQGKKQRASGQALREYGNVVQGKKHRGYTSRRKK